MFSQHDELTHSLHPFCLCSELQAGEKIHRAEIKNLSLQNSPDSVGESLVLISRESCPLGETGTPINSSSFSLPQKTDMYLVLCKSKWGLMQTTHISPESFQSKSRSLGFREPRTCDQEGKQRDDSLRIPTYLHTQDISFRWDYIDSTVTHQCFSFF